MYAFEDIQRIGIVGSGVMGHGIAVVAAQAGYPVTLYDTSQEALDQAQSQVEQFTQKSVEKQKLTADARAALLDRIQYTTYLDQMKQVQLVLEAIPERLQLKQDLFRELELILPEAAIFATNTSSIPITQIGATIHAPERLIGLHFFNPAPIMKLVEVVAGEATQEAAVQVGVDFATRLNKAPAKVKDTPGFIVNRVARFYYLESLRMVEEGVADQATMDRLMEATGFRMGPFKLMDLIGVDTNHAVTNSIFESFYYSPRFRPSRLQQKKVEAGHHGRKSKRGFYDYSE
jgi:3-hydroxybutyryl-CoA dehydrogenase